MSLTIDPAPSDDAPDDPIAAGVDRRDLLKKMAVGGAIAWSAPMISKTVFAAGPTSCVGATVNFNDYATGSTFNSATLNGITMTLSPSTFYGGSAARATNRTIIGSPIGGITTKGLRLEQDAVTNGGQQISLSFSQAVYDVDFVITDIDNQTGSWTDRITIITPTTYTYSIPTGSTVIGAGTASGTTTTTGPFRNSQTNLNYNNSQPGGNVQLNFPGPLTTITIQFWCAGQQSSNQLINFSAISFCG